MKAPILIFPTALFIFLTTSYFSWAQDSLDVSGIVFGREPAAIVNNDVLKVGGKIQGYTVKEIRKDSVVFLSPDGTSVTKMVTEKSVPASSSSIDVNDVKSEIAPSQDKQRDEAVQEHLIEANGYITSANQALQIAKVPNAAVYEKAEELYGKAEREVQFALTRSAAGTPARETARRAINGVQQSQAILSKTRKAFEDGVTAAIQSRKVVLGMTKSQVRQSLGAPKAVNTLNYHGERAEEWQYLYTTEKIVHLYFEDDILTAYEY